MSVRGSRIEGRGNAVFPEVQVNGFLLPLFHNDRPRLFKPENALPKFVEDR